MFEKGICPNPEGRPKITLADFQPGWEKKMLELYAEGASDIVIRADVFGGICHETWERLLAEEPMFSEAVKRGRVLSESWWVKKGQSSLDKQHFQNGTYALHMKNRFRWTDRMENDTKLSGPDGGPVKVEQSGSVKVDLEGKSLDELTRMFADRIKQD